MAKQDTTKPPRFKQRHPETPDRGLEIVVGVSMTEPDKIPGMRQLFERHAMGIKDNVHYEGKFSGDAPDLRNKDPHEIQALLDQAKSDAEYYSQLVNDQTVELRRLENEQITKRNRQNWEKWQENTTKP